MISSENTYIALFSYNKTNELEITLSSVKKHLSNFTINIYDDGSDNPETLEILKNYTSEEKISLIKDTNEKTPIKASEKCGNLHRNMQRAYLAAQKENAEYILFLQDDVQIMRDFSYKVREEYQAIFDAKDNIIQIDLRFIRMGCNVTYYNDIGAYFFPEDDDRRGYADVGLFKLDRLKEVDWIFLDGERPNKDKAIEMGLLRVFPFSPLLMHVPFPSLYRNGKKLFKNNLISGRGTFSYYEFTQEDISNLDKRHHSTIPYPKEFLRVKGSGLLKHTYKLQKEKLIYGGNTFFTGLLKTLYRKIKRDLSSLKTAR